MNKRTPSKASPSRDPRAADMPALQMSVPLERLSAQDLKYHAVQTLGRAQAIGTCVLDALWHHAEGNPGEATLSDLHLAMVAQLQQLEFAVTLVFDYWPEAEDSAGGEACAS